MKKRGERAKKIDKGTNSDSIFHITLTYDLPTLDASFGFLIRLYKNLLSLQTDYPAVLNGQIPEHYDELADKYVKLTNAIKGAI